MFAGRAYERKKHLELLLLLEDDVVVDGGGAATVTIGMLRKGLGMVTTGLWIMWVLRLWLFSLSGRVNSLEMRHLSKWLL